LQIIGGARSKALKEESNWLETDREALGVD
jgi:hypothetical protein